MGRIFFGTRAASLAIVLCLSPMAAHAAEDFNLVIKDHRFEPARLVIPAGKKVKVVVVNQDPTPEEFESGQLNREKIIGGKSQAVIFVGPLRPGEYKFFGDFHQDTAQGLIVAKEA